jgi:hypothetical protein
MSVHQAQGLAATGEHLSPGIRFRLVPTPKRPRGFPDAGPRPMISKLRDQRNF